MRIQGIPVRWVTRSFAILHDSLSEFFAINRETSTFALPKIEWDSGDGSLFISLQRKAKIWMIGRRFILHEKNVDRFVEKRRRLLDWYCLKC
jgi:hypothetical protein